MTQNLEYSTSPGALMHRSSEKAVARRALPVTEAAHYCGSNKSTFAKLRMTGDGPHFLRPTPNRVVYLVEDLDAWLDSKTKLRSTSELEAA